MGFKRILIWSDNHSGHKNGLTPPAWHYSVPRGAPRSARKNAALRVKLWRWVMFHVKQLGKIHAMIHLGDNIEGKGARSEGVELITSDREEQARMAAECIRAANPSKLYMLLGTPYHGGAGEDWENQIAVELGAEKVEAEGHYDINGLQVAAKHFIGNTSSPISRATAMSRAQLNQMLWSLTGQQPRADLILRGHVHRYARYEDAFGTVAICPALQGLGSRYPVRQMDGVPCAFGFLVLDVKSREEWALRRFIAPMVLQAGEVLNV